MQVFLVGVDGFCECGEERGVAALRGGEST